MNDTALKNLIAVNIAKFRKQAGLTQLELADKLNYSDKAVSKWERAESCPDIYVLKQIADLFKIRVDDLLSENKNKKIYIGISVEKRIIFPIMACLIIFLLATLVFGMFKMLEVPLERSWLCFIFALPVSFLSFFIFSSVWRKYLLALISASFLIWTMALSLYVTLTLPSSYIFFIIALPIQAIFALGYVLIRIGKKRKNRAHEINEQSAG